MTAANIMKIKTSLLNKWYNRNVYSSWWKTDLMQTEPERYFYCRITKYAAHTSSILTSFLTLVWPTPGPLVGQQSSQYFSNNCLTFFFYRSVVLRHDEVIYSCHFEVPSRIFLFYFLNRTFCKNSYL